MADNARIEDLRRRIQKDPASIAFAQLAEEYRRAGRFKESVDTCRAGLVIHPGYLSARVTLGRTLVELGQLDEAKGHLELVLSSAPENLAAIRGLAEIYDRLGQLEAALTLYKLALIMARKDPDLEETVESLSRRLAPGKRAAAADGLSYAEIQEELLNRPEARPQAPRPPGPFAPAGPPEASAAVPVNEIARAAGESARVFVEEPIPVPEVAVHTAPPAVLDEAVPTPAARTIDALEQWLAALHGTRPDQHA